LSAGLLLCCLSLLFGYGRIDDAAFTLSGETSAQRAMIWGIPCAFIVAGAIHFDVKPTRSKLIAAMVLAGDASYSIYLIHAFVFRAVKKMPLVSLIQADVLIVLLTALAVLCGIIAFKMLEVPIRRINRVTVAKVFPRKDIPPALGGISY
jgi:exopolysaccharide production protein ExoZ